MECNGIIGKDCKFCNEPCIYQFSDSEYAAYKKIRSSKMDLLKRKKQVEEDLSRHQYYRKLLNDSDKRKEFHQDILMNDLYPYDKPDIERMFVKHIVNIDAENLRKELKEINDELRFLMREELEYSKKL